jgi:hypothetical protein
MGQMVIRPLDIIYMLEDEDLIDIHPIELSILCNMASLDQQLHNEKYGKDKPN